MKNAVGSVNSYSAEAKGRQFMMDTDFYRQLPDYVHPCGYNGGGRQLCDGNVGDNFENILEEESEANWKIRK